jgi:predicted metal-dependent HD superfamily phosphohydrolase
MNASWLEEQWTGLSPQLGSDFDSAAAWERLKKAYLEPHRRYHTLQHLEHCLREFGAARHLAQEPLCAELALWFHDVCYDTQAGDNEEQSARLAESYLLKASLSEAQRRRVAELILETKHAAPPTLPDGELVVDADLSILGQDATRYAEFEEQVRAEYRWVPGFLFRRKRKAILQSFVERAYIYRTEYFRERYEESARRNLAWALRRL